MFPIAELKIAEVTELQIGDYAYLEDGKQAALIAKSASSSELFAIFINDWTDQNFAPVAALNGFAVVVPQIELWADPSSAFRSDSFTSLPGTLARRGPHLFCFTRADNFSQTRAFEIGECEVTSVPASVAFSRWKILARRGDQTEVLYEKTPNS